MYVLRAVSKKSSMNIESQFKYVNLDFRGRKRIIIK